MQPCWSVGRGVRRVRFQRIHRSYIVNLAHVEEVSEGYVLVGKKNLSLSQPLREEFLRRFNIV